MKEKVSLFIVAVLASLLLSLGAVHVALQNNWLPAPYQNNYDEGDSVKVAQVFEQLQSPQLYSIKEVLELQQTMLDQRTTDELFMSMTDELLQPVVSVLLKTEGYATKELIVKEYRASDRIYNNLPAPTDTIAKANEVDLSATDLGSRPDDKLISSSMKRRTDTVNGKAVKIVTKTEESYE